MATREEVIRLAKPSESRGADECGFLDFDDLAEAVGSIGAFDREGLILGRVRPGEAASALGS